MQEVQETREMQGIQNTQEQPMTPREIVAELDRYIIGQGDAKKAVAIALRNRWRRLQLEAPMRQEVTPKNILMIGPTGVGKTEIARRLAKLANAPFIKVEATKFTEVGYVGKDAESIIRDLMDSGVKMYREQAKAKVKGTAQQMAENRVLDILVPQPKKETSKSIVGFANEPMPAKEAAYDASEEGLESQTRALFRKKLRNGELNDKEIEIELDAPAVQAEIMGPPGMEEMTSQLQNMFSSLGSDRKQRRRMKILKALKLISDEEAGKLINEEEIKALAIERVEQNGIVFLDEIDKVCKKSESRGGDVSREGVQRDLLPLIEGSTVSTKYGVVKTDHILFIASGAFHVAKPSDLIPELQGRLPIRVELKPLSSNDFVRILTEPDAALTKQYIAMLATEDFNITFQEDAVNEIAEIAYHVNENVEDIGARRLHTVLEKLLDEISFHAPEKKGDALVIDQAYVLEHLSDLVKDRDLSRYIL